MNRRSEPGFDVYYPAKIVPLDDPQREIQAFLADLSADGLRLVATEELQPDQLLCVEVGQHLVLADVRDVSPRGSRFTVGAERIHTLSLLNLPEGMDKLDRLQALVDDYHLRVQFSLESAARKNVTAALELPAITIPAGPIPLDSETDPAPPARVGDFDEPGLAPLVVSNLAPVLAPALRSNAPVEVNFGQLRIMLPPSQEIELPPEAASAPEPPPSEAPVNRTAPAEVEPPAPVEAFATLDVPLSPENAGLEANQAHDAPTTEIPAIHESPALLENPTPLEVPANPETWATFTAHAMEEVPERLEASTREASTREASTAESTTAESTTAESAKLETAPLQAAATPEVSSPLEAPANRETQGKPQPPLPDEVPAQLAASSAFAAAAPQAPTTPTPIETPAKSQSPETPEAAVEADDDADMSYFTPSSGKLAPTRAAKPPYVSPDSNPVRPVMLPYHSFGPPPTRSRVRTVVLVAVLVSALALTALFFEPIRKNVALFAASPAVTEQTANETPQVAPVAANESPATPVSSSTPERLPFINASIKTSDSSWISGCVDGKVLAGKLIPGGSALDIEFSREAQVVVGNAGGVQMALGGKPLGPLGPQGKPRLVELTPSGFRVLDAGTPAECGKE